MTSPADLEDTVREAFAHYSASSHRLARASAALSLLREQAERAERERRYIEEGMPDPFDGEPLSEFMLWAKAGADSDNESWRIENERAENAERERDEARAVCAKAIRERQSLEIKEDDWHSAYEAREARVLELEAERVEDPVTRYERGDDFSHHYWKERAEEAERDGERLAREGILTEALEVQAQRDSWASKAAENLRGWNEATNRADSAQELAEEAEQERDEARERGNTWREHFYNVNAQLKQKQVDCDDLAFRALAAEDRVASYERAEAIATERADAAEKERAEVRAQRDRLAAILDPHSGNRTQRRAKKHGQGLNAQLDDSVRQGG